VCYFLFIATYKGHVIRFNMKSLRDNDYFTVGVMLSTIVLQGGEPPRIFSPAICQYMACGLEKFAPSIEEIPDTAVRASLDKVFKKKLSHNITLQSKFYMYIKARVAGGCIN
jgi:hypothetical protein